MECKSMKKISLIILGCLFLIPGSLTSNDTCGRTASIRYVKGTAYRTINGRWAQIYRPGSVLTQNDYLKTGSNSRVELRFDDGSLVQIGSNSTISLSQYNRTNTGRNADIRLQNGSIYANVRRLRRGHNFRVTTASGVAGVRGTKFFVSLDQKKTMKVEVYKGKVEVSAKDAKVLVNKGQQTQVKYGNTPDKPNSLTSERRIEWSQDEDE